MNHSFDTESLALHLKNRGKLVTSPSVSLTPETLPLLYTPGVGAVSRHLAAHPEQIGKYSLQGNLVAVISDGSAVLGLGNIGPQGAYPVMEGKAALFKALGNVDAIPIVLNTQDPAEIISAITAIAPSFAGINLEDIAAPACYGIEKTLQETLSIPVMHDDQHATAIVVLAGLINAAKVTDRNLKEAKVVIVGAGAAGSATARLLVDYGVAEVVVLDSKGVVGAHRTDLDSNKQALATETNPNKLTDTQDALKHADIVIGLSREGSITPSDVLLMAQKPIVFALSNPIPDITPEAALGAGAAVVATGRSDYPNQINNVLVFPGMFRGLLDHGVPQVTPAIKLAAAEALAALVAVPNAERIVPGVFEADIVPAVAAAIGRAGAPEKSAENVAS